MGYGEEKEGGTARMIEFNAEFQKNILTFIKNENFKYLDITLRNFRDKEYAKALWFAEECLRSIHPGLFDKYKEDSFFENKINKLPNVKFIFNGKIDFSFLKTAKIDFFGVASSYNNQLEGFFGPKLLI